MRSEAKFLLVLAFWFLLFAEALSLVTASWPGDCIVNPEQNQATTDQAYQKNCPTFHAGIWITIKRADRIIGRHDKSIVAVFTVVLAISTIGLWIATLQLWGAGERQFAHAQDVATANSLSVANSISEAARTAAAMEAVANTIGENGRRQLRAYLAVLPGDTIQQNDETGIKFEFHPVVRNSGFSPAYDVIIKARTAFEAYRCQKTLILLSPRCQSPELRPWAPNKPCLASRFLTECSPPRNG